MYFFALYRNKEEISERGDPHAAIHKESAKKLLSYEALRFLFKVYEPKFWYWEIIETLRRLFFTSILAFGAVGENTQVVTSYLNILPHIVNGTHTSHIDILLRLNVFPLYYYVDCRNHRGVCCFHEGMLFVVVISFIVEFDM